MKLFAIIITCVLCSVISNAETCIYSLNKSSVKLKWTGFKTTKKVAVSGTFKDIAWEQKSAKSLTELMNGIKFKIKTISVDSGNSLRDKRVYKSFFKLMNEGDFIEGHGISMDEKNKTAVIEVQMNKERTPVIFSFDKLKDNSFTMKGSIDVLKHYKMSTSFNSISKLCEKLHTGADGVSKTWSDVELTLSGKIIKNCN